MVRSGKTETGDAADFLLFLLYLLTEHILSDCHFSDTVNSKAWPLSWVALTLKCPNLM